MAPSPKKRVLYLDPAGNLWGSEQSLLLMVESLRASGHSPYLCLPPTGDLLPEAQRRDIPCLPYFQAGLNTASKGKRLLALAGLIRAFLKTKPDLIHLNQAGAARYAAMLHRWFRCPVAVHCRLFEDVPLAVQRFGNSPKVHYIAISDCVAKALREQKVPHPRIHQITDPILIPECPAKPWGRTSNQLENVRIGFVGRLSKDKGIELFLRSMDVVLKVVPTAKAIIAGAPPNTPEGTRYGDYLRNLANEQGIAEQCEFLGFRKDIESVMRQFDLLVVPSEMEPWGRVTAEAMALGIPVVATASGGSLEIVQNGISGYLTQPGSAQELAQAVLKLINDPDHARQMGRAGRLWVQTHCDPDLHASAVEKVYDRLR